MAIAQSQSLPSLEATNWVGKIVSAGISLPKRALRSAMTCRTQFGVVYGHEWKNVHCSGSPTSGLANTLADSVRVRNGDNTEVAFSLFTASPVPVEWPRTNKMAQASLDGKK